MLKNIYGEGLKKMDINQIGKKTKREACIAPGFVNKFICITP